MAVEIKELVVKGIVNNANFQSDNEIIEVIKGQIESYNFGISSAEKREIIQECLIEMKILIDQKSNF